MEAQPRRLSGAELSTRPTPTAGIETDDPRSGCRGLAPLSARLEPWAVDLCRKPDLLAAWVERHGSPVNVLDAQPMAGNAAELTRAAATAGVDLDIFFARKANKALAFVDEAARLGFGVDVASEHELRQTLDRVVAPSAIVVTAAVKPRALLELCVAAGVTVVIDNDDEIDLLAAVAAAAGRCVSVAFRLAPELGDTRRPTRFGLGAGALLAAVDRCWSGPQAAALTIAGIHFHLDGYAAADRVTALGESLTLIDALVARGHRPSFVDIGGGIPMSYLDDPAEWAEFWRGHRAAVRGEGLPLTFDGHGLGLTADRGETVGRPAVYPYHQRPIRGDWLAQVLAGRHIAADLRARGLRLRCEPGRSLLDGCGLTAARVEFRKQRADGAWLIGLGMNRTQCRSTSDEHMVDPLLLRPAASGAPTEAIDGYLVGAYCIERELLSWRRLRFPAGVAVGDIVVFPNTAGYLMHILESASHQIPLARNLVVGSATEAHLDEIDRRPV